MNSFKPAGFNWPHLRSDPDVDFLDTGIPAGAEIQLAKPRALQFSVEKVNIWPQNIWAPRVGLIKTDRV